MSSDVRNNGIEWLCVTEEAPLREVLERQAGAVERGLPAGIALVVAVSGELIGVVTDGDVRRAILQHGSLELTAGVAMTRDPIVFPDGLSFQETLRRLPGELQRRSRRSRRFLGKIVQCDPGGRPVRVLDYHQLWEQRVATHRHIAVVGMGYVGLTLALELAKSGFRVTGVDAEETRVEELRSGRSHVYEKGLAELLREQLRANFEVSSTLPDEGDVFILAVGTPVRLNSDANRRAPVLRHLEGAAKAVAERLRPGALVVLRSTVPVGATREVVLPILETGSGLQAGTDFHLSFAPERTAEGRALEELRTLPQIIGGLNDDSVEATAAMFRELAPTIVRMSSLEEAELVKLVNNAFRDLSFSFANQIALLATRYDLDVVQVVQAANRGYPRDRVPLPSPGVGGPCLTKDPFILASLAADGEPTLFELGREVNESMHTYVASAVLGELERAGKPPATARVLLCGLAFKGKPETGDLRDSSSLAIAELLKGRVGEIDAHDSVVTDDEIRECGLTPVTLPDGFSGADAVLFLNNHDAYSKLDVFAMTRALASPAIVFDGWHTFEPDDVLSARPGVYIGLGFRRRSTEP